MSTWQMHLVASGMLLFRRFVANVRVLATGELYRHYTSILFKTKHIPLSSEK